MKIEIKGPIISDSEQSVYDWFGIPATSPGKVLKVIDKANHDKASDLTVVINSGGGSVFSASEIYTELKKFAGKVKVEIVGLAASAASLIAMAGSRIEMSPTGQMMIHNASTYIRGDYRDMDHASVYLQKVNQSIMNAYSAKTRKDSAELKRLMDEETWMTAQEAKKAGFIDAIMFENEFKATASAGHSKLINGTLPQEVISKVRDQFFVGQNNKVDRGLGMEAQTVNSKDRFIDDILIATGHKTGTISKNAYITASDEGMIQFCDEIISSAGLSPDSSKELNSTDSDQFAEGLLNEMGLLKND